MNKQEQTYKTSVGGQALIEGVMMRGPEAYCVAVRTPNGEIETKITAVKPNKWGKVPLVRGVINYIESLITGYQCLMYSAETAMPDEVEEDSKFEKWISKTFGEKGNNALMVLSAVLGGSLAIVLFMVLPTMVVGVINSFLPLHGWRAAVEGLLKIGMFIIYLALISQMKDIKRMFGYHGAEHKTIACYEAGEELTVENIRKHTRFHPRCGTSFILIVLLVSILVSSFITVQSTLLRVVLKLVLLPLVMGISYELIRFAGRHDNFLTKIISAPGLWTQRLTTNEPLDEMIEVAIASVIPVMPEEKELAEW